MPTATIVAWSRGALAGGRVALVVVVGDGPMPPRTPCDIYANDWTWRALATTEQRAVYLRARALLLCGYAADALALVQPWADGTVAVAPWAVEWVAGNPPG